jgi:ABC-type polysaccharide/polyol phosphate transport system ATPase subunit
MAPPAVRLHSVSKRFLLDRTPHRTFMEIFVRPFRRRREREYFWPLRDVSFELTPGQSLGIIGENGSGKSTILKLIAGILEPTSGTVETNGRVAALLELGAGFHQELTGRENIFLAASIAGITGADIRRKQDEIITFADIGPYIDMPVKHYSSGMYVRLGFAVAVHLAPDILLVDEVLAVGDEAFQHKCLATIKRLQRRGVSVVLVSHGMDQIADMCDAALWLHEGYVAAIGTPERVIADYLTQSSEEELSAQVAEWAEPPLAAAPVEPAAGGEPVQRYERGAPTPAARRWGDAAVVIEDVRLLGSDGRPSLTLQPEAAVRLEFDYVIRRSPAQEPVFGIAIYRADGVWCYGTNTAIEKLRLTAGPLPGRGVVAVELPALQLLHGDYTLDVAVHAPDDSVTHDYIREAVRFYVKNPKGDSGLFRPQVRWSLSGRA